MSFAAGTRVNAGSAVAYLFLDPKQFTQGLSGAASEIDKFYQASARSSKAQAQQVFGQRNLQQAQQAQKTGVKLAQDLQKAEAVAAQAFAASQEQRIAGQVAYGKAATNASRNIVSARAKELEATRALEAAEARLTAAEDLRAATPKAVRGRFAKGGGTVGSQLDASVKAAELEVAAARQARERATEAVTKAEQTYATVQQHGIKITEEAAAANLESLAAIDALEKKYADVAAARRVEFADFSAQTQKRLAQVEVASAREIDAMRQTEAVRAELNAKNLALSGIDPTKKQVQELQNLEKQQAAAIAAEARATDTRIVSEEKLTASIDANVAARAAAYARDAEAAKVAAAEVVAAQQAVVARTTAGVSAAAGKIALVGAVIGGVAVASFVKFEQQMQAVQSIVRASPQLFDEMTASVKAMAAEFGQTPVDMAKGLYEIAQAGFSATDSMQILEASARAATAGFTTVEAAAKPIVATINAYGLEAADAKEITDTFFVGVQAGIFTFEELSSQLGDNLSLAHQLGISYKELSAAYIALTKQGNSLSESTTQINGIMSKMLQPTEDMQAIFKELGVSSGQDLINTMGGLGGALKAIAGIVGDDDARFASLFRNIRAIRGEFGLLNNGAEQFDQAMEQVGRATEGAGQTLETFDIVADSTAFDLAKTRAEITNAAIAFGEGLAPAVSKAAGVLGGLGNQFSSLSPAMQTMTSDLLGITVGITAVIAILAKMAGAWVGAGRALKTFTQTLQTSKFAAAATGIGLVVVGLSVLAEVFLRMRQRSKEHEQAVKDLAQAYENLRVAINSAKLAGDIGGTESLTRLETKLKDVTEESKNFQDSWEAAVKSGELGATRSEDIVTGTAETLGQLKDRFFEGVLTEEDLLRVTELSTRAIQTQGIDIAKVSGLVDQAIRSYELYIQTEGRMGISGQQLIQTLTDLNANIGDYTPQIEASTAATEAAAKAEEERTAQVEALDKAISAMADKSIAVSLGKPGEDLVPWIKGTQQGLERVGDTTAKIINRMSHQKVGGILNLDPDIQQAVDLQRNLERVDENIQNVSDAINTNADDMSMWSDRINLVTDTFGGDTDVLEEWMGKVDRGEITQQQFNQAIEDGLLTFDKLNTLKDQGVIDQGKYDKAVQAGKYLIERSTGALRDETLEQIDNTIALAAFVKEHDNAAGAINKATDAQRGFILALQDGGVQANLQTLQTLAYLEAINAIPAEKVTDFILNASQDPETAAVFEQMGLISINDETGEITVNVDFQKGEASTVEDLLEKAQAPVVIVTLFGTPDDAAIEQARRDAKGRPLIIPSQIEPPKDSGQTTGATGQGGNVAPPTQPAVAPTPVNTNPTVEVQIKIDEDGQKKLDHIYGQITNWVSNISTSFVFGSAAEVKEVKDLNNVIGNWAKNNATITTTFDFVTDVDFKTTFDGIATGGNAAVANLDIIRGKLRQTFINIATDASYFGIAAGSGFKNGFAIEIDGASLSAGAEMGEIRGQLNVSFSGEGQATAASFVNGFLGVLRGAVSQAYLIGIDIGNASAKGVADATQQGSPSKVAMRLGKNFTTSLVQGMASEQDAVASQAYALGMAMTTGIHGGSFAVARGSTAVTNPRNLGGSTIVQSRHLPSNVVVHQNVTVPAADFPEWISTMNYVQQLDQGFSTVLAGKRGR